MRRGIRKRGTTLEVLNKSHSPTVAGNADAHSPVAFP